MKVRIGVGVSGDVAGPNPRAGGLGAVVDALADLRFDSIWLPEILTASTPDPAVALAWAAARTPKLKLGTTCLVPGRNVIRLAKSLATLDALSEGRLLLTFVPGLAVAPERAAIGPEPKVRGALIDEALPLLRRLWAGEEVSHHGAVGDFDGVRLAPLPLQQPLEPWLGGMAPEALRRCGELADGWLPALCTPEEAAAGREVIDRAAAAAGRSIDPEHFGVSVGYATAPLSDAALAALARRSRGHDPAELVPVGHAALRATLEAFVAVGFTKFVLRPTGQPGDWVEELKALAEGVLDLQTGGSKPG
ncbi:LLM class flavin-dependent oxidoreductase [Acidiferrimicrobium sp. IK]|uniref:LLM class flavin-dependent oxidoreductase n=1 Tax=Acidiferrimicrobium sp. IK TaxID=2871700 RepID=UPI0021CB431E|nr:LLM class flavin-dependent oxidoreductase [Acidiferrimicrobium sp. IK]MCU4183714.1 LLM class flavin-dependent oxidoreductase [Acidiferrimicrobium sp. IK]